MLLMTPQNHITLVSSTVVNQ